MKRSLLACSVLAFALAGCGQGASENKVGDNAVEANASDAATIEATGSPATIGANGPGALSTETFVQQAAVSDMYEIQAAKIALQKSQSPAIKNFAQKMIDEHQATSTQLKGLLAKANVTAAPPAALDDRHAGMIEDLQKADVGKFDKVYLDQQTTAHREALGLMDSYANHGDVAALKDFAGQTKPKIQMHFDMVSKLDHGGADESGGAAGNSAG
jgi:putative membrane protein